MREIFTKEKIKKYCINILYFIIFIVILLILVVFIVKLFNIVLKEYFNISNNIGNSDIIGILSLNVGVLQAILGFGAIVAALLVFVNFQSTQNKLKQIDDKLKEHDEKIENYTKKPSNDIEKLND